MIQPVPALVDHLFRHASGRVLGSLVRKLGPQNLELAEDALQEAIIRALRLWPYRGVPDNPEAWIRRVAYNQAIDVLRRDGRRDPWNPNYDASEGGPEEDVLAMMLLCCQPGVAPTGQVALMLKLVAGFSIQEIARAFLTSEATTYQRIARARKAIGNVTAAVGPPDIWRSEQRIDALLTALYLLFNEGYAMTSGDRHVSGELCREAIRLTRIIEDRQALDRPDVEALLALMLLQAARIPGRVGPDGDILTLAEQDRSRWDHRLIDEGIEWLNRSARGNELTSFHLQAGIAVAHCLSPSYEETDWELILDHYDGLLEQDGSALIELNRAVAFAMVHGPAAGLAELDRRLDATTLDRYALFHATVGELAARSGHRPRAREGYSRARSLVRSSPELRLIDRRLAEIADEPNSRFDSNDP